MASLAKMQKLEIPEETPELFKKSELTDITLVVEGKELHFAKYPLMTGSSVFTTMINNSKDKSRLVLKDVPYRDMINYLECQHSKTLGVITDNNLEAVAMLAHRFKHDGILYGCEEYIIGRFNQASGPSDEIYPNFFLHLNIADKCNMKKAIQVGVSSARIEKATFGWIPYVKGYERDDNFCLLSADTKNQILSRRLKSAEDEIRTLRSKTKTLEGEKVSLECKIEKLQSKGLSSNMFKY